MLVVKGTCLSAQKITPAVIETGRDVCVRGFHVSQGLFLALPRRLAGIQSLYTCSAVKEILEGLK